MVDRHKLGLDIDDAITTGRDNLAVRGDVEGWCEHLAVDLLGVSMVGQMAGVPIGPHRLACLHAQHSSESVVLRTLFQSFLLSNCVDCFHHKAGRSPELGYAILATFQDREANSRETKNVTRLRIESLRQELVEMASQRSKSASPEAASVFRLTVELFEESELNAAQMLCETCEVAPELFEEKVVDLLALGVSDEVFAAKCLPVLTCLARKAPSVRDRVRPKVVASSQLALADRSNFRIIGRVFEQHRG